MDGHYPNNFEHKEDDFDSSIEVVYSMAIETLNTYFRLF